MRAGITAIGAALAMALAATPAGATPHFTVGQGQSPGVAVDAAGTAYIGWKVGPDAGEGDAVQLCVLPAAARACAQLTTIAFPDSGHSLGRVSVLLPGAPGVVQVVDGRDAALLYGVYLATSTDGGATFGAPVAIARGFGLGVEALPDGRLATPGTGVIALTGGVVRPDGSDLDAPVAELDERNGQFPDAAVQGGDVYVAGSAAGPSTVARLPAGADASNPAAWQGLPAVGGVQPQLAGGPTGAVILAEPRTADRRALFAQRWNGAQWTAPARLGGDASDSAFALTAADGRLTAAWDWRPISVRENVVDVAISDDGGALWSSVATLARATDDYPALEAATAPSGAGVVVGASTTGDGPVDVFRIDPRRIRIARAVVGNATVQLRAEASCDPLRSSRLRVQAATGGVAVSPATLLRRARFSMRRGRVLGRHRWNATVSLRGRDTARVRIVPRQGRARTLRLVVRACGRVA